MPVSSDSPQATLVISAAQRPGIIDGLCTDDYLDATVVTFNDAGVLKTVYLKHDNAYLYVCMIGAPGTPRERFASVYLELSDVNEFEKLIERITKD